jgi:acyl carrier protein
MSVQVKKVIKIISEVLGLKKDRLKPDSISSDFEEWDSLGHLRIFMGLEERLDLSFDMEKIPELNSVEKILKYIDRI